MVCSSRDWYNVVQISAIIVENRKNRDSKHDVEEKGSFREMDLFELGEEEMEIVGQKVEMRRVK